MFGRDFNPVYLFGACKFKLEEDDLISGDDSPLYDGEVRTVDMQINSNEWIEDIDSQRNFE